MTHCTEAKLAGWAYLSYIVFTMSSSILFAKATGGSDVAQTLSTLAGSMAVARLTVVLDLLQIVCAVVLAATLFRLVQGVQPTLALLAMLFRTGEGLLGFLPILSKLELMRLATLQANDAAGAHLRLLLADGVLHRSDDGPSQVCFVVGGFVFAWLLLRGRLIPRWLAWTGVLTIGVQLLCVPLKVAMVVPERVVDRLWLPILLYEIPLGILLVRTGVAAGGPDAAWMRGDEATS